MCYSPRGAEPERTKPTISVADGHAHQVWSGALTMIMSIT